MEAGRAQLRASAAPLAPLAALAAREEVSDLPDDSGPVEGAVNAWRIGKRALRCLERSLRLVVGENVLSHQEIEDRDGERAADHGRSKRAAGEGRVRHD